MIGTYARSFRHLKNSVENGKPQNVIINAYGKIISGCIESLMNNDNKEILALFQNMIGNDIKRYAKYFLSSEHKKINSYLDRYHSLIILNEEEIRNFSSIIMLPDNFKEEYEIFRKNNRKLMEQVDGKYCYLTDSIPTYMYVLIGDKPNLFIWALNNIYKHNISLHTIYHIIKWSENYNNCVNKLSKGTITAYNGKVSIALLEEEMFNIRREKRAKDSINIFNTCQKKLLKSCELDNKALDLLNKFGRLSKTKKSNFVRKMSTISDINEIFKQMLFLTNSQFEWNKESVIEYIQNAENINAEIIEDNDNILLVKVNDYETIKYLARTTNWCISKNKKYWNEYIEYKDGFTQYVIFDFSKKEDDNLSIVGFTISDTKGITNAHNFINDNLMDNNEYFPYNLSSFMPHLKNDIFSILKKDNININRLTSVKNNLYHWDKESFVSFLNYVINENNFDIIHDSENSLVLKIKDENTRYLIGNGYDNVVMCDNYISDVILFADFSCDEYDSNRILWGIITNNEPQYEECCLSIYNIHGNTSPYSLDTLLNKYNMPYNTISRIYNKEKIFKEHLVYLNIEELNKFFSDKEFMANFKKSHDYYNNMFFSALTTSVFRCMSFDLIDSIYNNGLKLTDVMAEVKVDEFINDISNEVVNSFFNADNHMPTDNDFKNFYKGKLNPNLSRFIGFYLIFKKICDSETNDNVFQQAIRHIYSERGIINLISVLLAKHINPNMLGEQEYFFNVICGYNCEQTIDILLAKNLNKDILECMKNSTSNSKLKEKIEKYSIEPSFSFS